MRLHRKVGVLVARRAVDAQPHPRPGANQVLHPARPRAEPHVARGAVRDAGLDLGDAIDLGVAEMDAVRVPDVLADPTQVLHELDGAAAEFLEAEALLVKRLGEVRVQPDTAPAREHGRVAHELGSDRKRRAGRDHDATHRAWLGIVIPLDHRFGVG